MAFKTLTLRLSEEQVAVLDKLRDNCTFEATYSKTIMEVCKTFLDESEQFWKRDEDTCVGCTRLRTKLKANDEQLLKYTKLKTYLKNHLD